MAQRPPGQEGDGDGAQHQEDVYELSPGIEEQARQQQNEIFALPRYEEIDQQAQRQETL